MQAAAEDVTLVLVPPGRGRWSPIVVSIPQRRSEQPPPVEVKVGDRYPCGSVVYRVARVMS